MCFCRIKRKFKYGKKSMNAVLLLPNVPKLSKQKYKLTCFSQI